MSLRICLLIPILITTFFIFAISTFPGEKPADNSKGKTDKKTENEEKDFEEVFKKISSKLEEEAKGSKIPWAKRHVIKTRHFEVNCNNSKEIAEAYAKALEALYGKMNAVFRAMKPDTFWRYDVYITATETEFRSLTRMKAPIRGYYDRHSKSIFGYTDYKDEKWRTINDLSRNVLYAFFAGIVKSQDSFSEKWICEGLAVVMEGVEIKNDYSVSIRGPLESRLNQLQKDIKAKKHVSISKMFDPAEKWSARHDNTAGFFVWWLLKDSKDKQSRKLFESYFLAAIKKYQDGSSEQGKDESDKIEKNEETDKASQTFEEMAKELTGKELEEISIGWEQYVKAKKVVLEKAQQEKAKKPEKK